MSDDPTIHWTLANFFGILVDEVQDAWFSGHVNDVLEFDAGLLVATDTGGVWLVPDGGGPGLPLSNEWSNPDINCLVLGPHGPRHVFAGCREGIIRETDLSELAPFFQWREVVDPLPADAGDVKRIVIIRNLRRIVAACSGGLYWATIPPGDGPTPPRTKYDWRQATVERAETTRQGFWDVAIGAINNHETRSNLEDRTVITIVAGGLGEGGIYVGQWDESGDLVMRRATIHNDDGTDATGLYVLMGSCSVASCESRPTTLYAGCAWKLGRLFRVLGSKDGGRSWGILGQHVVDADYDLSDLAGDQGDYNNCIAVAPKNPGLVLLGWVSLFLTIDGGSTWRLVKDRHLHSDVHALRFGAHDPDTIGNVFIGSDGGVARMNLDNFLNPPGSAFQSNYNRQLPTLQCLETRAEERYFGTLGASKSIPGIIATGTQDNGNLRCLLGPSPTPWVDIDGGDGAWNAFTASGTYLHNTLYGPVAGTLLNAAAEDISSVVIPVAVPSSTALYQPFGETVSHPTFHNAAGHRIQAVGAVKNEIFALYLDESNALYWNAVGSIPSGQVIASLASFHGGTIFVGTQTGEMYAVDTRLGTTLALPVELPKPVPSAKVTGGYINRIVAFSESDAFALMNGATASYVTFSPKKGMVTTKVSSFVVLKLDVLKWIVTPGFGLMNERMLGLEAVALPQSRVPRALFVSTDDRVYISRDDGATWQRASLGLPRFPHCADLRFVSFATEAHLYLSTFGRSVWMAKLR